MTLFTIDKKGKFSEFNENKFKKESKDLDLVSLIAKNPSSVFIKTDVLLVGQNVPNDTEQAIGFLGADKYGNAVIIAIEEKKATRKTLFRLLEQASYVETLDYNDLNALYHDFAGSKLGKAHEEFFNLNAVTVDWNLHAKLVIVSQKINPELIKVATYLRTQGLDISCVEFKSVNYGDSIQMVSREIIVGKDDMALPQTFGSGENADYAIPESDKDKFFNSLDENGRLVFSKLFDFAKKEDLEFKWTSQGFSLNVVVDDEAIGLCYGYSMDSLLNQSIYTGFDQITKKVNNAEDIVVQFQEGIEKSGFFNKTRSSFRWDISEKYASEEIEGFLNLLKQIADKIRDNGLIGIEAGSFPVEA